MLLFKGVLCVFNLKLTLYPGKSRSEKPIFANAIRSEHSFLLKSTMKVFDVTIRTCFLCWPVCNYSSEVDRAGRFEMGVGSIPGGEGAFLFFYYFCNQGVILDTERLGDIQNHLSFHLTIVSVRLSIISSLKIHLFNMYFYCLYFIDVY